ncbi:MAG: hypothetical protein ABIT09_02505 [Croceibacterium sp.]
MPRKLKVFRMPIGFEDVYVAAPSRAAALRAWGAEHDQFARGVAEEITDPVLTHEPLAKPGEVIRKSRGDLASQLKALPRQAAPASAAPARARPPKPKPPPKRDKLDRAEAALAEVQARYDSETARIEKELAAIRAHHTVEQGKLARTLEVERKAYRAALEKWGG